MKAKLFATLCISLFILSLPQTFGQTTGASGDTPSPPAETAPITTTNTSEEQVPTGQSTQNQTPQESSEQNQAQISNQNTEQASGQDETPKVTTPEEIPSSPEVTPTTPEAIPSNPEVTPTTPEAISSNPEVTPTTPEETPSSPEVITPTPTETGNDSVTPSETPSTEDSKGNGEPQGGENQAATGSTNEGTGNESTVPVEAEQNTQGNEAQETGNTEVGGENGGNVAVTVFGVLIVLGLLLFVGCVYNYRYQMERYKIAPFTPPTFCPNFLFPRNADRPTNGGYNYTELAVGGYRAPAEF